MAVVNTLIAELKYAVDTSGLREFARQGRRYAQHVEREFRQATRQADGLVRAQRASVRVTGEMSSAMTRYTSRVRTARHEMQRLATTSHAVGNGRDGGRAGGGIGGGELGLIGAFAGGM